MNEEDIEIIVRNRDWSFSELSNLRSTISALGDEIYHEMNLMERFSLVRDAEVYPSKTYEESMKKAVKIELTGMIAEVFTKMLETAKIDFGGNKNEISERSVGGKSHQERPTDEEKSSTEEE
jgi:hypothetical protein